MLTNPSDWVIVAASRDGTEITNEIFLKMIRGVKGGE